MFHPVLHEHIVAGKEMFFKLRESFNIILCTYFDLPEPKNNHNAAKDQQEGKGKKSIR
jgi:hypothetical protein